MITIGTFLLCFIFIADIVKYKNLKDIYISFFVISAIIELWVERGYFLKIDDIYISYRTISELLLCVISFIVILTNKVILSKKNIARTIILILCVLFGLIGLILFPSTATGATMEVSWDEILVEKCGRQPIRFNGAMKTEIFQVAIFIFIYFVCVDYLGEEDWKRLICQVVRYSWGLLVFSFLEIVADYILKNNLFYDFVGLILGHSPSTYESLNSRGIGYMLTGLTKEGSHYVFSLSIFLMLNLIVYRYFNLNKDCNRKLLFGIVVTSVPFLLSMSFSVLYYGVCFILFVLCISCKQNKKVELIIIFSLIPFFLLLIMYLLPQVAKLFENIPFWGRRLKSLQEELEIVFDGSWLYKSTALEWSNRVRLGSTIETFKLVLYRPFWGLGFSATTAHSSLAMLVSGCGIVGSFLYISLIFGAFNKKNNKVVLCCLVFTYLLMNILNSLSLRPFYESWVLLLAYSFSSVSNRGKMLIRKESSVGVKNEKN